MGWRLDLEIHGKTWDSGEGAYRVGGRWNAKGKRAVYCSVDPSTAILEVAVHKTFKTLDTVPHVLTCLRILDPSGVHVVQPADVPNPNWLVPGIPGDGQQKFGNQLLADHPFVLIPSAVSSRSWNLIFDSVKASGAYELVSQERFALDTRLHPPS
ncbi:MAG TPA: RES domain-containing protein [Allosphingosinicella sp.]|jgi:RES domain-containing protein